jgi:hypothetical protein
MPKFVRWVPKQYAEDALAAGFMSHCASALWVFDLEQTYRPGVGVYHGAILLAYDLDRVAVHNVTTRQHIDFEGDTFLGEAAHPRDIILKENEPGAYGVGKMRQHCTRKHVKTRYATKKEVGKALGKSEMEVTDTYKPKPGWPA